MFFVDTILELVELLVNGIFAALNSFFEALGIGVTLEPIDL